MEHATQKKKVIERHTRRSFITFNQLPGNWHLEIHELPHAKGPYGLAPKILGSKGLLAQVPLDCRADRQWPGLLASRYCICICICDVASELRAAPIYFYYDPFVSSACCSLRQDVRIPGHKDTVPHGYLPPAECLAIDYWQTAFNYCSASGQRNSIRPPNNDAE